jgi:hypothetical protein
MMNQILPIPMFPGISDAQSNFNSTRQALRSKPFCVTIDLSVARDVDSMLNLPIAGNVFYIDQRANTGTARIHFQDQTPLGCPITVFAGFLAEIPFTQIAIENDAQPGQSLQIIFGTDLKFIPSNAAGISLLNAVSVVDGGRVRTKSNQAFFARAACSPVAAQNSACGIQNKSVAAGSNIYVESLILSSDTPGILVIGYNSVASISVLANILAGSVVSKNAGHIGSEVTESRWQNAGFTSQSSGFTCLVSANVPLMYVFREPILLSSGEGICFFIAGGVNVNLQGVFEICEDA